jgi:hypothetical protein
MKKYITLSLAALIAAPILVSCDEELANQEIETEERLADYVIEIQSDVVYLYNILDEGLRSADYAANDSTIVREVKVKKAASGDILLDFGAGVQATDGVVRSGTVTFTVTGDYATAGSNLSTSFDDFKSGERDYTGMLNLDVKAANSFDVALVDFGFPGVFEANLNQSIVWLSGYETPADDSDDNFTLQGNFSGIDLTSTDTVTAQITNPFNYDKSCEYGMVEGSMDVNLNGPNVTYESGSLDFISDDGCLNLFEISVTDGEDEVKVVKSFKGF